jgi:hypothetical protein
MSTVPTIRPYATRDEWRRDFHVDSATHRASSQAGLASIVREVPTPDAPDVWDVLDRETGEVWADALDNTAVSLSGAYRNRRFVLYNRRTGEVVYGAGVQS